MFELKRISREGIPEALAKAHRYRLLNDPALAESICHDVLAIDHDNQEALITLILAMTDQLGHGHSGHHARELIPRLEGEYERAYYSGLIAERTACAHMRQGTPGSSFTAYEAFREAMAWYERAEAIRPQGNDDAILRWNTCVRTLMRHPDLRPRPEEVYEAVLDD